MWMFKKHLWRLCKKEMDMKSKIDKVTKTVKNALLDLVTHKVAVVPLQLTRVTEKFDSLTRPPFRGGIADRTKN